MILIPGNPGSKISRRTPFGFLQLWPGLPDRVGGSVLHRDLKNDVVDPNNYIPIANRDVIAVEIFRHVNLPNEWFDRDYYGGLIEFLTNPERGYTKDNVQYPTLAPCDPSRNSADLFVFPYDWRNSNQTSAEDLKQFVQCIKEIRQNQNQKVHIIAHSNGGLVARRYILNNPSSHSVERMVTLGTPWLGAPKAINVMQTGDWGELNKLISKPVLKEIALFIRGAHELLPSRAYHDTLRNDVFCENGWDNFDLLPQRTCWYSFGQLKTALNNRFSPLNNNPGTNGDVFHSRDGQDNWHPSSLLGVDYYNFVGYGKYTIGRLIAVRENELRDLNSYMNGDGTVPLVSALRYKPNFPNPDPQVYPGNIRLERGFELDHLELVNEGTTFFFINCVVNVPNADACINNTSAVLGLKQPQDFVGAPNYLMNVSGSQSVIISDSFGNTANPLSSSVDEGVPTIGNNVTGPTSLSTSFPLDQVYKAVIKAPSTPISITVLKSDGQSVTQAVRYVDIILPANVLALIQLSPQGVTTLMYDSNGDGTFDTPVNPTIVVTGPQASDIEPPTVIVNETVQSGTSRIELEATDSGTGVQRIMYSLNGTTFQQYSTSLILNPAVTPTIYVFADDNVANRSGLVTHNLTTSNVGFSVTGPSSAPGGSQIIANWSAPAGRPADDWVGLFRLGTLNSAYISRQHTNGTTSGSLPFTLPNQPGIYEFRYLLHDGFTSVAVSNPINVISGSVFDFDADGKTDISVWRPADGNWHLSRSTDGYAAYTWGASGDQIVPYDFDGDGKADVAVWRPADGSWHILSSDGGTYSTYTWGASGDVPVVGDYDGDGKSDVAVRRPSDGTFYILKSSGGTQTNTWGVSTDVPIVGDFDGDGQSDIAVRRPSTGEWFINRSTAGYISVTWGVSTDIPVHADYDGDQKDDVAVWRPSTGEWFILRSTDGGYTNATWGASGDVPVPGDYDGDGKADISVVRNGVWHIDQSTAGYRTATWGVGTDIAIPGRY